jgi:ribonuclease HI
MSGNIPSSHRVTLSFWLEFPSINNQAEYKAIVGLEILLELGTKLVTITKDMLLIINWLASEYKCEHPTLTLYYEVATNLIKKIYDLIFVFPMTRNNT